jgi:Arsenical resistance operon protein ArsD
VTSVKVFDPAMCCSTGVCGPSIDPDLARFAADLNWLAAEGVSVERFNLAQQPEAFVTHAVATQALREHGEQALPLILVDERKVSEGAYPSRDQLAQWAGIDGSAGDDPSNPEPAIVGVSTTPSDGCSCGDGGCC